ncbi:venom serine carboxypeptidase-like [Achroia grisella]|uniref:venom serine carboxypeptidase-like n=1 Tax=Achroia grisella TaxID=688607 RepID=UPI0027D2808D|nr:venom serine carboxypeptidase-like [Achroia grisella]
MGNTCDNCLILTALIKNGSVELARNLSQVNSDNFKGVVSYSGFITVKEQYNSNMFFWYFPHPEQSKETPWIIWLQGGPGYSSLFGLFILIGPIHLKHDKVQLRNITWANDYSLLFIDNPVGAGFSFTTDYRGYISDEDAIGEQLYEFLQQFVQVFPELHDAPLFIAGESYAGKYIPALGIQIHRHREKNHHINLRGMAVGNGLIDPRSMMHYSDLCKALGILDTVQLNKVKELETSIVKLIDENKIVNASNKFNETIEYIKKQSAVNIYNFHKEPDVNTTQFERFVNRADVRNWIHVGNATYNLNNEIVYQKMLPDIMNSTKPFVEELLEHYGFLCYSGQLDLLLPYSLSKYTYQELSWSRQKEYRSAPRKRLRQYPSQALVGFKKYGGNFMEILIRGAGHMVPLEQPDVLKFIMDSFISQFTS